MSFGPNRRFTILGISNGDASGVCLVRDGEICYAASEERFSRIKNQSGWPTLALSSALDYEDLSLEEVDAIAYGYSSGFDTERHLLLYLDRFVEESRRSPSGLPYLRKRLLDELKNDARRRAQFDLWIDSNGLRDRVAYVDHHDAHAIGAFECSPFDDAMVLTCDGRGDFRSLTLSLIDRATSRSLLSETSADSLGFFYGRITALLGFRPNEQEGKVTGLSALGNPAPAERLMESMISIRDGRIRAHFGELFEPNYTNFSGCLRARVSEFSPEDIAAAAQMHITRLLKALLRQWIDPREHRDLCLAGGVFGNVRLNQELADTPGVRSVYVLPPMGDVGLPLQAAVSVARRFQRPITNRMPTMLLGPDASRDSRLLLRWCSESGLKLVEGSEVLPSMVAMLHLGRVIGTYRKRAEFGPRALCDRSIIAGVGHASICASLNHRLNRTDFMPFGPIVAVDYAQESFPSWTDGDAPSRFMTMTYLCSDSFRQLCPAVVHIDGTARPQIIHESDDPFIYRLLHSWRDATGQLALINTSFNVHEEPIVGSAEDVFGALMQHRVDAVLIEDQWLVAAPEAVHDRRS